MTDTIKVAVIGAGMMGKNHLKTYKGLNGVELVGVYDIFPEACKAAAETFGIKAFSSLEEVEMCIRDRPFADLIRRFLIYVLSRGSYTARLGKTVGIRRSLQSRITRTAVGIQQQL